MLIKVTKEDIELGVPDHYYECPIATAINRSTLCSAGVSEYVTIMRDNERIVHLEKHSRLVKKFIKHFDKTGKGKPFSFKLKV